MSDEVDRSALAAPHSSASNNTFHYQETTTKALVAVLTIAAFMGIGGAFLALHDNAITAADASYARVKAEEARSAAEHAERRADLAQYYSVDMEIYLYKQGLKPPEDPWAHPKKGK